MTQADRDRLVTLKKAKKKLITQCAAAEELGCTVRHVKRLLYALKKQGDKAVVHGLRGKPSNRKIDADTEAEAVRILSAPVYAGFGPTLACEYLRKKHGIAVSKETVRQWMLRARLWRPRKAEVRQVHLWRPRRSRFGELVQWDTSEHDWLEGRGEKLYLIAMIDDATSRLLARFVRHDSVAENMKLLWTYLARYGRPLAFYMDRASMFRTTAKRKREEPGVDQDPVDMPATQIVRALQELGIVAISAHSPQAKGRVERNFGTAQDRLVKGMRVARVKTIEAANRYLEDEYLVWWEREMTVEAANPDDAHRPLEKSHNLAASLCHMETRQVRNNYTFPWGGKFYQIERQAVTVGLRRATVRVEQRLDGSLAVRHGDKYLPVKECAVSAIPKAVRPVKAAKTHRPHKRGSDWNKNFDLKKAPKVWQAAQLSGGRAEGAI